MIWCKEEMRFMQQQLPAFLCSCCRRPPVQNFTSAFANSSGRAASGVRSRASWSNQSTRAFSVPSVYFCSAFVECTAHFFFLNRGYVAYLAVHPQLSQTKYISLCISCFYRSFYLPALRRPALPSMMSSMLQTPASEFMKQLLRVYLKYVACQTNIRRTQCMADGKQEEYCIVVCQRSCLVL